MANEAELLRIIADLRRRIEALEAGENKRVTPYGIRLPELTAAPSSPVDGDFVYADGTSWNPGSGEGTYERRASAWVKL